jgi:succinyl-CoA synthetase beta subunit
VDLFEYQARDLFEAHGIPVLAGKVATTPDEAKAAAAGMGGKVVVKAQVKIGGRESQSDSWNGYQRPHCSQSDDCSSSSH